MSRNEAAPPRAAKRRGGPELTSKACVALFTALMAMALSPVAGRAQVMVPPNEETLELPTLEEELGTAKPQRDIPPISNILAPDAPLAPQPAEETERHRLAKTVKLNGLDKITGRISEFEAPVDQPAQFGTLQIVARTCHKRPPEETPETSAYLEIADLGFAADATAAQPQGRQIFSGWMFASSPSLSALEHPVYDVWVIDCSTSLPEQESGAE